MRSQMQSRQLDLFSDDLTGAPVTSTSAHTGSANISYRDAIGSTSTSMEPSSITPSYNIVFPQKGSDAELVGYSVTVLERLKRYFYDTMGIAANYFGDVKVRFARLPGNYIVKEGKDGKELVPTGKVFGMYKPDTGEIFIDESLDPKADSAEKAALQKYMEIPTLERVLGEEYTHHIQNQLGIIADATRKLGKRARGYIEGAAASVADSLFGKTGLYAEWKEVYGKKVGREGHRAAFLNPEAV